MTYADRVSALVAYAGQTVTVRARTSTPTMDLTTLKASASYADTVVTGSVRLYKPQQISGLIQEGDKEVRIAAQSLSKAPTPYDKIIINGAQFNIVSVNTRSPQNVPAIHIIQVRGS